MTDINTDQIVDQLGQLTAPQLVALTKQLEVKWGVSAAPAIVGTVLPKNEAPVVVAQTEFDVILTGFATDKKISVIKELRVVMGLGLNEAKALAESAPKPIKEGIPKAEADEVFGKLTAAGATVEIR